MKIGHFLNLCLGLSMALALSVCASAADYDFDGVDDSEYYPSTNYDAVYGCAYNYGGKNAVDYDYPDLPYGVVSNTSVGAMERVRVLDSNGYVSSVPNTGAANGSGGSVYVPGIGEIYDPTGATAMTGNSSVTVSQVDYPLVYQRTAFTNVSDMILSDGSIGTVSIPTIKINMKVWNGETNESMAKGLGHYTATSGWNGNVGVCGHNRGAKYVIGSIKGLKLGDTITYTTVYGTRTYAVSYVGTISNTDWTYLKATADNRITITTCLANQPSMRVVVQATEIK